jgi:hypothetical protein
MKIKGLYLQVVAMPCVDRTHSVSGDTMQGDAGLAISQVIRVIAGRD